MFRFIDWLDRKCTESATFAWGLTVVAVVVMVIIAFVEV